jgi:hypothetical protein
MLPITAHYRQWKRRQPSGVALSPLQDNAAVIAHYDLRGGYQVAGDKVEQIANWIDRGLGIGDAQVLTESARPTLDLSSDRPKIVCASGQHWFDLPGLQQYVKDQYATSAVDLTAIFKVRVTAFSGLAWWRWLAFFEPGSTAHLNNWHVQHDQSASALHSRVSNSGAGSGHSSPANSIDDQWRVYTVHTSPTAIIHRKDGVELSTSGGAVTGPYTWTTATLLGYRTGATTAAAQPGLDFEACAILQAPTIAQIEDAESKL